MGTAVPGLKLADDQHRDLRMREHARRLAAEDHPAEPAAAMRGHGDGVALALARSLEDPLPGLHLLDDAARAAHAGLCRFALEQRERAFRLRLGRLLVILVHGA